MSINAQINPSTKIVAKHVTMHNATKDDVGLGNVNNTSDVDKPISTLTQAALNLKADTSTTYTKTEVDTNIANLVNSAPGNLDTLAELSAALGNDDDFAANLNSYISTKADQSDLNTHIVDTDNPHQVTATLVQLGNVTNESKATMFTDPTFTGTVSGITPAMVQLGNVTNESKATMFTDPNFTGDLIADRIGIGTNTPSKALDVVGTSLFSEKVKITPEKGLGLQLLSSGTNNSAVSLQVQGPVTVGHDLFQRSGFTGGFADGSNHFHSIIDINRIEQEDEGDVKNIERVQERYYAVQGNFLPNSKAVFWAQHRVARPIDTSVIDTSAATLDVSLLQSSGNRDLDNQAFFSSNTTPVGRSEEIEIALNNHGLVVGNNVRMEFSQAFEGPIVAAQLFGVVTSSLINEFKVALYGGNYKTTIEVPSGTSQTALTFDNVILESIGENTIVQGGNETDLQLYSKTNFTPERLKDETLKATWSVAHGLVKNEHCTLITDGRGDLVVKQSAYVLDPDPDSDGLSVILVYGRRIRQFDLSSFTAFGSSNWTLHKGTVDGIHDDTLGDNLINFNANNHGEYTAYQIGPGSQTDADCISIGKNVYNKDASTIKIGYDNAMLDVRSDGVVVAGNIDATGSFTTTTGSFTNNTVDFGADGDRAYIGSQLGIGANTPTAELDVVGNVKVSLDLTVNTDTLKVDASSGNVGIGTTSPSERLEVRKDIDNDFVRLKLDNQGANGGASIFFNEGATTHASIFATYGTGYKSFSIKNSMPNGTLELQTENSSGITNDGLIIDGDSNVSIPNGSLSTKGSISVGVLNTTNSNLNTGGSIVVGTQNTINGNNSLAVGLGNTTNRSGNYALGDRNVVGHPTTTNQGGNSAAIGSDNVLYGANSFVAGNNNTLSEVTGTNTFESSSIIGNNNTISLSLRSFVIGQGNTITTSNDAINIGKNSTITGNNSIALGTGLKDFGDANTVIFGRYNADPGDASKVVIGAGFSDTARYSAIEVESKSASMRARSKLIFRSLMDTNSYSSDSAAAAAGVVLGELYRDGNTVKIRMT